MEFSWTRANQRVSLNRFRPYWPLIACVGAFFTVLAFFNTINAILPTADDVYLYFDYARRTFGGEIPFVDFRVEYPPFAVVFFLLPALFSLPFGGLERDLYAWLFHTQSFVLEALTLYLSLGLLKRVYPQARQAIFTPRLIWYTLGGIAISLYLLQRFDIGATFLMTLGLYWLYDRKPGLGGAALALGTAAKLYPAIALPLAVLYFWRYKGDKRSAVRCMVGFGIAGAVVVLPFLIANPAGMLAFLKFHSERGIEIEALVAMLMAVGHYLGLAPAISINDHNSLGITSTWSNTLSSLSTLATLVGLMGLIWFAWKATSPENHLRADWLIQAAAIGVLWFILANKVLSPQYLIWMLTFVPFWKGRKQPIFLVALIMSFIPFPFLIDGLFVLDWLPMTLLAIRNGLLIALFIQLIPALEVPRARVARAFRLTQPA